MKRLAFLFLTIFPIHHLFSQGTLGNEEITITKEKQVSISKANRVFERIPPVEKPAKKVNVEYELFELKPTGIQEIDFKPSVLDPNITTEKDNERKGFGNYLELGAGNFGRLFGELHINSPQNQDFIYGLHVLQNSLRRGPVQNENSGLNITKVDVDGKYHSGSFKLTANAGYLRQNYYFYGYDTTFVRYEKEDIRQRLDIVNFNVSLENTKPRAVVDYKLTTGISSLSDFYEAQELDWGTKFTSYFPILKDKVTAVLDAEAYLTQRTDNYEVSPTRKRNLFRVSPFINVDLARFNARIGYKAVNEFDEFKAVNSTLGFPSVTLTYKTPQLLYFFAGYDGDILRNTLHKFYTENPFIKSQVNLENTIKNAEYFVGSRGELTTGLKYNCKASYGQYSNLYYYNIYDSFDGPVGVRRFEVYYDNLEKTDFVQVSGELNYQAADFWQTNVKADYFYFETKRFARPYHRPSFEGRLGNIFNVSDKIVATLDTYVLGKTVGLDPFIGQDVDIPTIVDVNTEITYLFSRQFAAFVKLNNLVGNNYQRYLYYPQLGLNFVTGINVAL